MTQFTATGNNVMIHKVKFDVRADANRIYEGDQAGLVSIDIKIPSGVRLITLKAHPMSNRDTDNALRCYPRLRLRPLMQIMHRR